MAELLKQVGLPATAIAVILISGFLLREAWALMKSKRIAVSQQVTNYALEYINSQLKEFYLPIAARLKLSEYLFNLTQQWINDETDLFDHKKIQLQSEDNRALSKIVTNRLFLPVNRDIEKILLSSIHLRHPDDDADYQKILSHFIVWRVFEEAAEDNLISSYDGSSFLKFPAEQAEKVHSITDRLIQERDALYVSLLQGDIKILKSRFFNRNVSKNTRTT